MTDVKVMSVAFLLPAERSRDRDRFSHGSDVPYDYVSQAGIIERFRNVEQPFASLNVNTGTLRKQMIQQFARGSALSGCNGALAPIATSKGKISQSCSSSNDR